MNIIANGESGYIFKPSLDGDESFISKVATLKDITT